MDGSVLGVSRSVPSSPGAGERSPSDKFNMNSSDTQPSPAAETVRYNKTEANNPQKQILTTTAEVPHINITRARPRDPVSGSRSLCRQSTLESPCYQPSPHHRHPYQSVPSPPRSPRGRQLSIHFRSEHVSSVSVNITPPNLSPESPVSCSKSYFSQ